MQFEGCIFCVFVPCCGSRVGMRVVNPDLKKTNKKKPSLKCSCVPTFKVPSLPEVQLNMKQRTAGVT